MNSRNTWALCGEEGSGGRSGVEVKRRELLSMKDLGPDEGFFTVKNALCSSVSGVNITC